MSSGTLTSPVATTPVITGSLAFNSFFKPAERKRAKLRMAICGPTGAGKTFSALRFAYAFKGPETRVVVINTESGAVEKYMGLSPDGFPWQFYVGTLDDFSPSSYTEKILLCAQGGVDVVIIDSLSHAWNGVGGALEQVDKNNSGNSYTAWKTVTPQHNRMVEAILRSPCHLIVTMRSKMEYVLEANSRGKMEPKKIGLAPIQRAGMEYEFDIVADMTTEHVLTVGKTRCPAVDGFVGCKPGIGFMSPIVEWLTDGVPVDPGYYASTQEDLDRLEREQMAKMSPADRAKAAAQKQMVATGNGVAANGNGHAAHPPTAAAIASQPQPSTAEQHAAILSLAQTQFSSPDEFRAFLSARGVEKIARLTFGQAESMVSQLQVIQRMEADPQPLPTALTAPPQPAPSFTPGPANYSRPGDGKVSDVQRVEIRRLAEATGWPKEYQGVWLQRQGFTNPGDLSFEVANVLIEVLRKVDRIRTLCEKLGVDMPTLKAKLATFKVASPFDLDSAQAQTLIDQFITAELAFPEGETPPPNS